MVEFICLRCVLLELHCYMHFCGDSLFYDSDADRNSLFLYRMPPRKQPAPRGRGAGQGRGRGAGRAAPTTRQQATVRQRETRATRAARQAEAQGSVQEVDQGYRDQAVPG